MKKILVVIVAAFLPVAAFAQNFQNMSEQDMANMMQKAMEVQICMEKIDQAELQALEQRANAFEAEVEALCAEGKRDKAQKKAIAYGKEMAKNPVLQDMKKCTEPMQGVMQQMPMMQQEMDYDKDYENIHVCDEPKEVLIKDR